MVWRIISDIKYSDYYTYSGEAALGNTTYAIRKILPSLDSWVKADLVDEINKQVMGQGGVPLRVTIKAQELPDRHEVQAIILVAPSTSNTSVQIAATTIILLAIPLIALALALWIFGHAIGEVKSLIWGPGGDQPWIPIAVLAGGMGLLITAISRFAATSRGGAK